MSTQARLLIVDDEAAQMKALCDTLGIEGYLTFGFTSPTEALEADESLLRQVFVNLLPNALKFTRHRPAARIEVGGRVEQGTLECFVSDNGAGFDMKYAGKLFGAFQRLHSARDFEGTGVGLSIVKRIVQRHGGRVSAEAAVERGATIYFTLPLERQLR